MDASMYFNYARLKKTYVCIFVVMTAGLCVYNYKLYIKHVSI